MLVVGVIGVVAEGCRRLCRAKSGGGSSEPTGVGLVDLGADAGGVTLDADAGGVGPDADAGGVTLGAGVGGVTLDADAGGVTHRVDGGPATAPAENGGASENKEAGGAVGGEGEIRCACSGHGGGGSVTFAEVSWRLGWGREKGGKIWRCCFYG